MVKRHLRSGFTTGACAAAAVKAAITCLDGRCCGAGTVEIPFPDGMRRELRVKNCTVSASEGSIRARASVIKDAGDDPDVTNGAEIAATVSISPLPLPLTGKEIERAARSALSPIGYWIPCTFIIKGGEGVGIVTKPGLAVAVGEPAINPVPRAMILEAAREAIRSGRQLPNNATVTITISVVNGDILAQKTLNHRLGIVGGISILGTTGIVTPLSADAWKATITSGMDVAKACGCEEVVVSAGRASEKGHMNRIGLPEESYVLMGDHLGLAVGEAAARGFSRIHVAAQWAKLLKIAMATPQTHVKFGALNPTSAALFLHNMGIPVSLDTPFNTAREIFDLLLETHEKPEPLFRRICGVAARYVSALGSGIPTTAHLIGYNGELLSSASAPRNKNS